MFKKVTITNYRGESVEYLIEGVNVADNNGLLITDIDGLGPVKANINMTKLATADGGIYNSARLGTRNIVIKAKFTNATSIEDARLSSYKFFPIKKKVTFKIETDNRTAITEGYVESNTPNPFSEESDVQISIICESAFFYGPTEDVTTFAGVDPLFEFQFENNVELVRKEIWKKGKIGGSLFNSCNGLMQRSLDGYDLEIVDGDGRTVPCCAWVVTNEAYSNPVYVKLYDNQGTYDILFAVFDSSLTGDDRVWFLTIHTEQKFQALMTFLEENYSDAYYANGPKAALHQCLVDDGWEGEIMDYTGGLFEVYEDTPFRMDGFTIDLKYMADVPTKETAKQIEFGEVVLKKFANVYYSGDSQVGCTIELHTIGNVTKDITIYNLYTRERMELNMERLSAIIGDTLILGDTITICTVEGKKSITFTRNAETTNILNALEKDVDWLTLSKGNNVIGFIADEDEQSHIKLKVSSQVAYEGV